MATNIFAKATELKTQPKAKKSDRAEIQVPGLMALARIDAAMKALKALKETHETKVHAFMRDYFVRVGCATKSQPENFRGLDGAASASMELRKRSVNSQLTEAQVLLCTQYGVPVAESADRVETFVINPAYLENSELMEKVGLALSKVKGIPEDFIQKQVATKKMIVTDESLASIFSKPVDDATKLFDVVGVLAVKPKIDEKIDATLKGLADLIGDDD